MEFKVVPKKPEDVNPTLSMWLRKDSNGVTLCGQIIGESNHCEFASITENGILLHSGVAPKYGIATCGSKLYDSKLKVIS